MKIGTVIVGDEEWEEWEWTEGTTILQRSCPACDRGLLLQPARFCGRCKGSGFINRFPDRLSGAEGGGRD